MRPARRAPQGRGFRRFFARAKVALRSARLYGRMPLIDLIAALGLFLAAALAVVTVLTAVLVGLSRLELATVPARRR